VALDRTGERQVLDAAVGAYADFSSIAVIAVFPTSRNSVASSASAAICCRVSARTTEP